LGKDLGDQISVIKTNVGMGWGAIVGDVVAEIF
jgi:hypothetical protein